VPPVWCDGCADQPDQPDQADQPDQPELRTIVCTAIGWVIYDMTNEPDQPDQPDQLRSVGPPFLCIRQPLHIFRDVFALSVCSLTHHNSLIYSMGQFQDVTSAGDLEARG
jgi:hypothetical protein